MAALGQSGKAFVLEHLIIFVGVLGIAFSKFFDDKSI